MIRIKSLAILIGALMMTPVIVHGQGFSSGSTGADGALDLSAGNRQVQVPDSGFLNYTTVNIPANRTLTFARNSRNTPVIILVQGNVNIAGTIDVSAVGQAPGPGGFYGGPGNFGGSFTPGFGPGGGQPEGERNGRWVGALSLAPIIGGSGGTGGNQCTYVGQTPYGGGGGGAIVIASSQSITLTAGSNIVANGSGPQCSYGGAGGGSGGAIRLIANSLNVAGTLSAYGANAYYSPNLYHGVIRLEAPQGARTFTGSATPAAVLSTINTAIVPSAPPSLTILSVGGFAVPSYSGSRLDTLDLMLPNKLVDPIPVVVKGINLPVGTQVMIQTAGSLNITTTPCTLAGSLSSSACTCTLSNLNRTAVTYLLAVATFDPPASAQAVNSSGPNRVAKVRVESLLGGGPKFSFLRADGTVIEPAKVSKEFVEALGL